MKCDVCRAVAGRLATILANGEQRPGCTLSAESQRLSRKIILTE